VFCVDRDKEEPMFRHTLFNWGLALLLGLVFVLPGASPAMADAPGNDNSENATVIGSLPFNDVVDISEATLQPGEPYNCGLSKSVWYRFEPSATTVLRVSMDGSTFSDSVVNIWQGTDLANLNSVSCASWGSTSTFTASAGQTYYLQAGKYYDELYGELHLTIEQVLPPDNDDFANAAVVLGLPYYFGQDTTGATVQAGEPSPSCAWNPVSNSVWYAFTATGDESLMVGYSESNFSPVVAVYTGSSLDQLTELGCRTYHDRLTFAAQAGTTYYLQFGSLYGYGGWMSFNVEVTPPPQVNFYYYPGDPSVFDTVQFYDSTWDPGGAGVQTQIWNFGDGVTAEGCCPSHRYAADGSYTVTLTVTTIDGRTGSTSQTVTVMTHDVAITRFAAPKAASAGQTRQVVVGVNSRRYVEQVSVDLYKSVPGGYEWVGRLSQQVPVRPSNRTTEFNFSYTFTPDDALLGKITFRAVATIQNGRDVLPADNEAIASPTKVN
jgi:hypothetical protein